MEKEIFAKLFNLKMCQVLITKGYDPEEHAYTIEQRTVINEEERGITLLCSSRYTRDEVFKRYSEFDAKKFIVNLFDFR
jgi:hypothetical protein